MTATQRKNWWSYPDISWKKDKNHGSCLLKKSKESLIVVSHEKIDANHGSYLLRESKISLIVVSH